MAARFALTHIPTLERVFVGFPITQPLFFELLIKYRGPPALGPPAGPGCSAGPDPSHREILRGR